MTAWVHGAGPVPGYRRRDRERRAAAWRAVGLALVTIAIVAVMVAGFRSERTAIRGLPRDQRLTLVSRSVEELKQFCGDGRPDALRDHCRDLASFVARFDECTGECAALAHGQLTPTPTR